MAPMALKSNQHIYDIANVIQNRHWVVSNSKPKIMLRKL